ncbi:MAG: GTP-binding protein [Candidatus Heimdallarchaeota archaeon]|nr:GTP-binding protein [Candidatus Heimdallarchaeota archaeon]MCK4955129.1 GTP-binding protein [Candidatus Heimdallarchaeota archaeon]
MIYLERASIAITGLQNAGKTSLTQRLLTGRHVDSQPTFGVDVEFTTYRNYPLKIWDMGGHMSFRTQVWKNYIKRASAFIFIFDASDISKLEESSEWFWKCFSWIEKEGIPVVFLANKWDLVTAKDEAIKRIVSGFRLEEMATVSLQSPFQFFFVSVKTGAYISDAMNWLIVKNFIEKNRIDSRILSFDLFMKAEEYSIHIHDNTEYRDNSCALIDMHFKKWLNAESNIIEALEEIIYKNLKVFIFSHPSKMIILTTKSESLDKSIFTNIVDSVKSYELADDMNSYISIYESTKQLLINSFQSDISDSLSCDIFSEFANRRDCSKHPNPGGDEYV